MKRLLRLLPLLPLLFGFTLYQFTTQTERVRWESFLLLDDVFPGLRLYNTFHASTSPAGGFSIGEARWRMSGLQCTVYDNGGRGETDGGTNFVAVAVKHEDGGTDCHCILGQLCGNGGIGKCDCGASMTHLAGSEWYVEIVHPSVVDAGASGCQVDPGFWHCSVDLFR